MVDQLEISRKVYVSTKRLKGEYNQGSAFGSEDWEEGTGFYPWLKNHSILVGQERLIMESPCLVLVDFERGNTEPNLFEVPYCATTPFTYLERVTLTWQPGTASPDNLLGKLLGFGFKEKVTQRKL